MGGHHPGLEEQGSRPAHWVDERGAAVPSGQGEESGSKIFLHGSLSVLDPVSSFKEGGAGHVEGQGSPMLLEVDHHMNNKQKEEFCKLEREVFHMSGEQKKRQASDRRTYENGLPQKAGKKNRVNQNS